MKTVQRRNRTAAWSGWLRRGLLGLAGGILLLLFGLSCAHVDRAWVAPLTIEGAQPVGSGKCLECHADMGRAFATSTHGRRDRGEAEWGLVAGCESCHGPGSRHVATGAGEWILNPGREPEACYRCHQEIEAEFHLPHRHPLLEGRVSCVDCHDPHGTDIMKTAGGLAMARLNATCGECHRGQHRPFVFEHEALREGCVACHAPHGSIHDKLLTERDAGLCLKCHAQTQTVTGQIIIGKVDHTASLRLGTCYSAGCHMAVHGSNVQPKLRY